MLRITPLAGPAPALKLEGKLVGPWVGVLRRTCAGQGGPPRLDLAAVAFADAAGVRLLRELRSAGAELTGLSSLVAALLRLEET
jgi:hypothetical protein